MITLGKSIDWVQSVVALLEASTYFEKMVDVVVVVIVVVVVVVVKARKDHN